jgi:uncharacterized membrane protein
MKMLVAVPLWFLLFVVCWPLALLALLLLPLAWLLSIPFRVFGIVVRALLALLEAILFLPARILGFRRRPAVAAGKA